MSNTSISSSSYCEIHLYTNIIQFYNEKKRNTEKKAVLRNVTKITKLFHYETGINVCFGTIK